MNVPDGLRRTLLVFAECLLMNVQETFEWLGCGPAR